MSLKELGTENRAPQPTWTSHDLLEKWYVDPAIQSKNTMCIPQNVGATQRGLQRGRRPAPSPVKVGATECWMAFSMGPGERRFPATDCHTCSVGPQNL